MKNLLLILCISIMTMLDGCNPPRKDDINKHADGSSSQKNQNQSIPSLSDASRSNELKKQILGIWIAKDEPEGFQISKDSIYYVSVFKSYKYTLTKDDTLLIYLDGFINKSKAIVNKDTLVLIGDSTYYFTRSK